MKLDHESPMPLYHQIKNILMQRLQKKIWNPGELIPTEQELMKEFEVSRTTLRQAINELVNDGLLEKMQGKGTIVKKINLVGSLGKLTGFAEEVMEKGHQPHSKLLRAEFRSDVFIEKKKLNVPEDGKVLIIERIRFADGIPIALERTSWPESIGEILMKHDLDDALYYQILEDEGIILQRAAETISAVNATPYDADLLGVNGGQALLEMERLSFGIDDNPIEYTKTKYRSDRYHYHVDLKR